MRIRSLMCAGLVLFPVMSVAQGSNPAAAKKPAGAAAKPAAASTSKVHGNLLQVMQGILFPNSNVIFQAQSTDPTSIKQDPDPTLSSNPFTGPYNGWKALENSGIAMAEAANLLTIPGRMCSNGKPVPMNNADWPKFVQELRDAGMAAYKVGQSKNMDRVVEVSDTVTAACNNCHEVYRDKTDKQGGAAARCTK